MRLSYTISAVSAATALAADHATCGYECTDDSDCGGCGSAGFCSCPLGKDDLGKEHSIAATSCSCSSQPANPPDSAPDVALTAWPSQFSCDVDALTYGDYNHTSTVSTGKFYYDGALGSKTVWTSLHGGNGATQIWASDTSSATAKSYYWVQNGPVCIGIPMTDPGIDGKPPVGIELPNWMSRCNDAGLAKYVGREEVDGVWTDHYVCHLDYTHLDGLHEGITFQNWHTLGEDGNPAGLPIRVTGGNSQPDPQQSPRLNTVWYSNFCTGSDCVTANDFKKPSPLCFPVGQADAEEFFGHVPEPKHVFSSAFQRRANFLPFAKASSNDLRRARQPKPGRGFTGDSFGSSMEKLNDILKREEGLNTRECHEFSLPALQDVQRLLFDARTPELEQIYKDADDTRSMAHDNTESLLQEQKMHLELADAESLKARDGVCHELVMWYVHHLSNDAREEIKAQLVLPLLPTQRHSVSGNEHVDRRYEQQVSCGVCHVSPASVAV